LSTTLLIRKFWARYPIAIIIIIVSNNASIKLPVNCIASTMEKNAPRIIRSPWARFVSPMIPKIKDIPTPIKAYRPPSKNPFNMDWIISCIGLSPQMVYCKSLQIRHICLRRNMHL